MDYESTYSKTQVHFVTQPPTWKSFLEIDRSINTILDLGSGGGHNSLHLQQIYPNSMIVPLDLSLIRCVACSRVVDASITCGNSMHLPFADNSFDLIISTQVIEHVPDDQVFVKEVERVLKPNGIAIVSSVIKLRFGWYFYRNHRGEWVLDPTHVREYQSQDEFAELFHELFSEVSLSTAYFQFSLARFAYRLLVKLRFIQQPNPKFFAETRMGSFLERLEILVPRYRLVTAIVKKH